MTSRVTRSAPNVRMARKCGCTKTPISGECQHPDCLCDCHQELAQLAEHTRDVMRFTAKGFTHGYAHAKKQIRFLLYRHRQWIPSAHLAFILAAIDALESTDGLNSQVKLRKTRTP